MLMTLVASSVAPTPAPLPRNDSAISWPEPESTRPEQTPVMAIEKPIVRARIPNAMPIGR